jgi:ABC-type glucose/galactose transport system permease subunit
MKLKIASGNELRDGQTIYDFDRIRFVAEDGRDMFEVITKENGTSLEIRAVNACMVGGVQYDSSLLVVPCVSNSIIVSVQEYGK